MFSEEYHQGAHMRAGKNEHSSREMTRESKSKAGMILVLALGVLVLMSMLAILFYTLTRAEKEISMDAVNLTRAEMLAQTGLEIVKSQLRRPPGIVQWSSLIELPVTPAFRLPTSDMADYPITAPLPNHHGGTPFYINWDLVVTPGFFGITSRDAYTLKTGTLLPTYLQGKFSDGEPFDDTGYTDPITVQSGIGAGNGKWDWYDANGDGIAQPSELTDPKRFEPFTDQNGNGVHDTYAGAVKFAVDDVRGTYSLSVLDSTGLLYLNDGILTLEQKNWLKERYTQARVDALSPELERRHSRHLVKILDNLGVILGMFTGDETYKKLYFDSTQGGVFSDIAPPAPAKGYPRVIPTGKGLGYYLIYGDGGTVKGRPLGGYSTMRDVRRVMDQINLLRPTKWTTDQINLFLALVTTVSWVDNKTVVGARFLYPEEQQSLLGITSGAEYNYYIKITGDPDERVAIVKGLNPAGVLIPGRTSASLDAKPRYDKDHKTLEMSLPTQRFNPMYFQDYKISGGTPQMTTVQAYEFIPGFSKSRDISRITGYLYEPRAPININSAAQPLIEACLTYLEATYVTDRENNLYPNGRGYTTNPIPGPGGGPQYSAGLTPVYGTNRLADLRTRASIFVGKPAYNFIYTYIINDKTWQQPLVGDAYGLQKHFRTYDDNLDPTEWGWCVFRQPGGGMSGVGPYNPTGVSYAGAASGSPDDITYLIERVNPTIHGTPSVMILPEEARAVAAAICEYRDGGSTFVSDPSSPNNQDLNFNKILDYGDDKYPYDGLLTKGNEWSDDHSNYYKGGSFLSWEQFWVFLNMQKFRLFSLDTSWNKSKIPNYGIPYSQYNKLDSRATNLLDLKVDLIFANANPNVDILDFNPNASWASLNRVDSKGFYLRRNITKFDLFDVEGNPTHTTEFCFQPLGVYQITSTGRVLGADGTLLAERQIMSAVRFFNTMRLTNQKDFEMGPVDPNDYVIGNPATHDDFFGNPHIAVKDQVVTLPEYDWRATGLDGDPRKSGLQANVAGYDGQITLAPYFKTDGEAGNEGQGDPALRVYARFGSDLKGNFHQTQDQLNVGLCPYQGGGIAWVRAQGNFRPDYWAPDWTNPGTPFPTLQPTQYDYVNKMVYTSYDKNRNGQQDYGNNISGSSYTMTEPSDEVIVKPLLEPEQYPLTHSWECWWLFGSGPFGNPLYNEETISSVWPFSFPLNGSAPTWAYSMQRFNNYLLYQETVPRYDREANLVPDGFLKCGVRNIWYDFNYFHDPSTGNYKGYDKPIGYPRRNGEIDPADAQYPTVEGAIVDTFNQSLVTELAANEGCLRYVVEMWMKPMFSLTQHDHSVQDRNWEDMFKWNQNWRYQTNWRDGAGNLHGDSGSYVRGPNYNQLLRVYFSGLGAPLSGGNPLTRNGSLLDLKLFLQPLQYVLDDYTCRCSYGNWQVFLVGMCWYMQRALYFDAYSNAMRGGAWNKALYPDNPVNQNWWPSVHDLYPHPTDWPAHEVWWRSDDGNVDTFQDYNNPNAVGNEGRFPEFRDGEWVHVAAVILKDQTQYYINGEPPKLNGSPMPALTCKDPTTGNVVPFSNYGIERIDLPDSACTVGEIRVYTLSKYQGLSQADEIVRNHFEEGRYFSTGTYLSPVQTIPKGSRIQSINWTEFFPRTMDCANTHDNYIKVILCNDSGGEQATLSHGNNTEVINADLTDFKIKVKIEAHPKNGGALMDTPVVDDITITYIVQEQILLWEIMD